MKKVRDGLMIACLMVAFAYGFLATVKLIIPGLIAAVVLFFVWSVMFKRPM